MPWRITEPMYERAKFCLAFVEGGYSMTELCERFGISRKTGYKWLRRFESAGLTGLDDQSRAPRSIPHKTPRVVEDALVELRKKHDDWGARKLIDVLRRRKPELRMPSASTATELLRRRGLVKSRRCQKKPQHPGARPLIAEAANDVWTADFKGEFRLGNRHYCYPLTVCDAHSRFLLACDGHSSTAHSRAQGSFESIFKAFGLPRAIRTDNGCPFATQALSGLSRLSLYWMKLGIRHDRINPGSPQENPRHERMHRALKSATTRPPAFNLGAQQRRFDEFRHVYNEVRPHEGIGMATPSSLYEPSIRELPSTLPKPDYLGHMEIRRVSSGGTIKFKSHVLFLSDVLEGEQIALEEVDDGLWSIYFYNTLLARLDEHTFQIKP